MAMQFFSINNLYIYTHSKQLILKVILHKKIFLFFYQLFIKEKVAFIHIIF